MPLATYVDYNDEEEDYDDIINDKAGRTTTQLPDNSGRDNNDLMNVATEWKLCIHPCE